MSILKDRAKKIGEVSATSGNSGAEQLIKEISSHLKSEGLEEKQYDFEKAFEAKKAAGMLTKANEVVHTTNSGFGAELIPQAVQMPDFLDLAPRFSSVLGALTGFHGRNLNKISELPLIGELDLHQNAGEWTTGSVVSQISQGRGKLPTDKITINQKKLLFSVDISDEETRFVNVVDVVAKIQQKLAESFGRTMESVIINGDTATGLNTNINAIDGTPAASQHYLIADGLRKFALGSASTSFDGGTLAFTDFTDLLKILGEHGAAREDILWLFNRQTELKSLTLPEFLQQYINGASSTVVNGKLPPFLGSDVAISRYLGLGNTAGKQSTDPANNVKGSVMAIKKDAVQYGYNGEYQMEIFRAPGFGWQVLGYCYAGVSVIPTSVGVSPRVAMAFNVTV